MQHAHTDTRARTESGQVEPENQSGEGGHAAAPAAPVTSSSSSGEQPPVQLTQASRPDTDTTSMGTDTTRNTALNRHDSLQHRLASDGPGTRLVALTCRPALGLHSSHAALVAPENDNAASTEEKDEGERARHERVVDGDEPVVETNGNDSPDSDQDEDEDRSRYVAHAMPSPFNSVLAELSSQGLTLARPPA